MLDQVSKRDMLHGRIGQQAQQRPPGAIFMFEDACTGCADCVSACPTQIIEIETCGLAKIDLTKGQCLFCSQCAETCQPSALIPVEGWSVRASITASCLSYNGTLCRACEDQCEEQAIAFRLLTGGRSLPVIDLDRCTGCGACAAPCPTQSISFFEHSQPTGDSSC